MARDLPTNPLIVRVARRGAWPSGRAAIAIALALAATSLLVMPHVPLMAEIPRELTVLLARVVIVLTPLGAAHAAAMLTSRDMQSQLVDLLHLTEISPARVVWGYVGASLYRIRFWLAFAVGLAPALALGMSNVINVTTFYYSDPPRCASLLSALAVFSHCSINIPAGPIPIWPYDWDQHFARVYASLALGLIGMNLLGASLGVTLTLWWRKAASTIAAPLVALAGMVALLDAALVVGVASLRGAINPVLMLTPIVMSVLLLRLAFRWTRKSAYS